MLPLSSAGERAGEAEWRWFNYSWCEWNSWGSSSQLIYGRRRQASASTASFMTTSERGYVCVREREKVADRSNLQLCPCMCAWGGLWEDKRGLSNPDPGFSTTGKAVSRLTCFPESLAEVWGVVYSTPALAKTHISPGIPCSLAFKPVLCKQLASARGK